MNLTKLGVSTLKKSKSKKQEIAARLMNGEEDSTLYVNGICYDQVAFVMHLLGYPSIDANSVISLTGADFLPSMGFVGNLSALAQWDGASPISPGVAIAFFRERTGTVFHAVLSVGGTNVRGVNSLGLGAAWSQLIDLREALCDRNPDGSFNYDRTTIRVYISSLIRPQPHLEEKVAKVKFDDSLKPPPPNYTTNENRKSQNLLERLCKREVSTIDFIDVFGEGFLAFEDTITGFKNSYNINVYNAVVLSQPDKGKQIPNIIPIYSFDSNFSVIPSQSVKIITVVRPLSTLFPPRLTELVCEEIVRMVNPKGNILIYGYLANHPQRQYLEELLVNINFEKANGYELSNEFSIITLEPVVVYTSKSNPNPYIHDEL